MKFKNVGIDPKRVKAGPDDGLAEGEFVVYPSTFTRTPDSYGDVVAKGAFLQDIADLKASGNVRPGLYGHRLDDPDFFIAEGIDEGEDDHGWWVKGRFDLDHPKAAHVYRLVKGRRLTQLSFAYDVLDEGKVELEDGQTANELRRLKVYEFSFVPIGANQDTSVVAIKAARDIAAKAGRVISAKNETSLREALSSLELSASQIKNVLAALDEAHDDDGKAAPGPDAKTDPPGSVEERRSPSPADLSALQSIELDALLASS